MVCASNSHHTLCTLRALAFSGQYCVKWRARVSRCQCGKCRLEHLSAQQPICTGLLHLHHMHVLLFLQTCRYCCSASPSGKAMGLSFSVPLGVHVPLSLANTCMMCDCVCQCFSAFLLPLQARPWGCHSAFLLECMCRPAWPTCTRSWRLTWAAGNPTTAAWTRWEIPHYVMLHVSQIMERVHSNAAQPGQHVQGAGSRPGLQDTQPRLPEEGEK
jgi:hypothetical protein